MFGIFFAVMLKNADEAIVNFEGGDPIGNQFYSKKFKNMLCVLFYSPLW
jgi:hypothetical protein|tara:strand:- start:443 stop:589 length:147 start_codon:yes stop_codon:yes gene_type:complete